MAKRRVFNPGRVIGEMFGRIEPQRGYGLQVNRLVNRLFGKGYKNTLDLTRNDYPLMRALYHGSTVPKELVQGNDGREFLLGSGLIKPIVNTSAAFAVGSGFKIALGGSDSNDNIQAAEDDINQFIDDNFSDLFDWIKIGYRDGDSYLDLDERAQLSILQPETVDVITEPVSGEVIGYNVTESVETVNPDTGDQQKWTYLKQYRRSWVRISRWHENADQKDAEVLYERAFVRGQSVDTLAENEQGDVEPLRVLQEEIDQKMLPIVHLANEPEPKHAYGFSDIQNTLVNLRNYTAILEQGTKREVYNNNPLLMFMDVQDPADDPDAPKDNDQKPTDSSTKKHTVIDQDTVVYGSKDANGKYITIDGTMGDTKDLLQIYFYLVAQASETPEFVFAMAIQSSKASTESQMPIVIAKAERKRRQMQKKIVELVRLYISRQVELSNPDFLTFQGIESKVAVSVKFPPVVNEDGKLNHDIVKTLLQEGAIQKKTAVELLLGDKVEDVDAEVKAAAEEEVNAMLEEEKARSRIDQAGQDQGGAGGGTTQA